MGKFFNIKEIHFRDDLTYHHKSHAAGAFYSSGFDEALVFSYDGGGKDGTFCVYDLDKREPNFKQINDHELIPYPTKYSKLGCFNSEIKKREGDLASDLGGAGKIMGLSSYGSYNKDFFDRIIAYFKSGRSDNWLQVIDSVFLENFKEFKYNEFEGKDSYDFAFNVQLAFETCFLERFHEFFDEKKHKNVCLTGGAALNVILNEKLTKTYPNTNFFVPSSPGDSGLSYGMIAGYLKSQVVPEVMYAGCPVLDKGSLPYILDHRPWKKATPELIAGELEKGKIIGVCRGDSETGPRALGNRSILADPRSHKAKDTINKKVKFREWFRPFAPICKEDKASIFFETSDNACYRYMSFSPPVREEYKKVLPAVTHVDGSARLQTISKKDNEFIYNILDEFEKLTNIPILVNTSFNSRGKSILTRYLTAIQILDSTELDAVVLEDYYIYK
jgi:carbamoyltransferase